MASTAARECRVSTWLLFTQSSLTIVSHGAGRRIIKKELGLERDDKDELVQAMTKKLAELNAPPAVEKVITEQLKKISMLEPSSPGEIANGMAELCA
jgi:hypothetical protein